MDSVLSIWHDYREEVKNDPNEVKLLTMEKLKEARRYTDINKAMVQLVPGQSKEKAAQRSGFFYA